MSWGFNEFPGETLYDSTFTTPGITYIAASGDYARRRVSGRLARRAGRRRDVAIPERLGRYRVRDRLVRQRRRLQPV